MALEEVGQRTHVSEQAKALAVAILLPVRCSSERHTRLRPAVRVVVVRVTALLQMVVGPELASSSRC